MSTWLYVWLSCFQSFAWARRLFHLWPPDGRVLLCYDIWIFFFFLVSFYDCKTCVLNPTNSYNFGKLWSVILSIFFCLVFLIQGVTLNISPSCLFCVGVGIIDQIIVPPYLALHLALMLSILVSLLILRMVWLSYNQTLIGRASFFFFSLNHLSAAAVYLYDSICCLSQGLTM